TAVVLFIFRRPSVGNHDTAAHAADAGRVQSQLHGLLQHVGGMHGAGQAHAVVIRGDAQIRVLGGRVYVQPGAHVVGQVAVTGIGRAPARAVVVAAVAHRQHTTAQVGHGCAQGQGHQYTSHVFTPVHFKVGRSDLGTLAAEP